MSEQPHSSWLRRFGFPGLVLVAAIVFAYQPAWNAGFIWDDDDYVTHNPLLTAPDGLWRIWFSTDSPSQYFPLVYTTFRAEHALWGLNAAGYHWVNILLHAVNALLVWRLLLRLAVPGAWLGAALFALHPVQVESVAWITELKNVQSLFFFLLSLLAWVEFVEERRGWRTYAWSLLCCALALFSKTTACTLPAALVLVLWLRKKPITLARAAQIAPYVAMGIAMGLVSIWWERNQQGTHGETYAMSFVDRLLVASRALWFYLGKLLWPADLIFNYALWKINAADALAYGWLAACVVFGGAILAARRALGRAPEVAVVFFVAMLSPLLGFIMLYTFKYTFVADHYVYVAVIGPLALAAAGLVTLLRRVEARRPALRWLCPALGGALVVTLGALTWRQARMYENLETLWRTTIERNPESYMGHNNLGAIYLGQGRIDDAVAHFRRALEIFPTHGNAHGNLGHALLKKGRVDDALVHFEQAVENEPAAAKAHSDFAFGLLQKGRFDEALVFAQTALSLQPGFPEAHNNLGWALLQKGRPDEALSQFQSALKSQPDSADTHYNLGTAFLHLGRIDQAVAHCRRALEQRPGFAKAHNNLGGAFLQNGQLPEAIAQFHAAVRSDPADLQARNNLGRALLQADRADEAVAQFEALAKLAPDFFEAHHSLGSIYGGNDRFDEAIARFEKAIELQPANAAVHLDMGWTLLRAGRADDGIVRLKAAIALQPDLAIAHYGLAFAFLGKGRPRDAVAVYDGFLSSQGDHFLILTDFAWLLATSPDATIRDPARALALARRANELSRGADPGGLRALAAALAENGQFAEAAAEVRRALQLLTSANNARMVGPEFVSTLHAQLKAYDAGAPYREPPVASSTPPTPPRSVAPGSPALNSPPPPSSESRP